MKSLSALLGTKKVRQRYSRPSSGWPVCVTFLSPASSISRGMYSSPSGFSWSVVWSRTVGSAFMTAGLVGVPLPEGETWGGDPWGRADVCSWGVCTGGAMPLCGGWEPRLGDPA